MPKSTKIFRLKEKVGLTSFLYVILWRVGIVNFTDESTFDLMEKVIIISIFKHNRGCLFTWLLMPVYLVTNACLHSR